MPPTSGTTETTTGKQDADDHEAETTFWYFAIGSMMNPVSIKGRGVVPIESRPGQLLDYGLYFFGREGFAEAVQEPGNSFHGVLHKVDRDMMTILDGIEHSYVRKLGKVRLYDTDELVDVNVYSRPGPVSAAGGGQEKKKKQSAAVVDNPPQQRYIEIMAEGAEYYGVKKEYVDFLRHHEQRPRPLPGEFKSVGAVPDDAPTKAKAEIAACDGVDVGGDDTPLWITINGKVMECLAPRDSEHFQYFRKLSAQFGRPCEMFLSHLVYDPKYGMPDSLDGFTREHSAYIEDWFCRYLEGESYRDLWRIVARWDQQYKD